MEEAEFLRGLALCQLIPGATMVQIVTYIGYRVRGILGALTVAVAFVLPAFIFLIILSALYFKFQALWFIQALFKGLGAIVVAIIFNACITFSRSIFQDWKVILIAVLSFFGFLLRWNILLIFLLAAVAALLLHPKVSQAKTTPSSGAFHQRGFLKREYLLLCSLAALICLLLVISYLIDSNTTSLSLGLSKIGALAFGGGFTTIPLIQYEVIDRFQWLSTKEFLDGIALGQVTPGPILITATFIGYKISGLLGALMATIGIFSPSFFILILLIPYYDRLGRSEIIRTIEQGILGSFVGMLGVVLYNFGRASLVDIPTILMAAAAFFALLKKLSLPYILLPAGTISIIYFGLLK